MISQPNTRDAAGFVHELKLRHLNGISKHGKLP